MRTHVRSIGMLRNIITRVNPWIEENNARAAAITSRSRVGLLSVASVDLTQLYDDDGVKKKRNNKSQQLCAISDCIFSNIYSISRIL